MSQPWRFGPQPLQAGAEDPVLKDAKGNPVFHPQWVWRCTSKPGRLYLHFFQWPKGSFTIPPLRTKVARAYLLADPARSVGVLQPNGTVTLALPPDAPDPIASVVVLETTP